MDIYWTAWAAVADRAREMEHSLSSVAARYDGHLAAPNGVHAGRPGSAGVLLDSAVGRVRYAHMRVYKKR